MLGIIAYKINPDKIIIREKEEPKETPKKVVTKPKKPKEDSDEWEIIKPPYGMNPRYEVSRKGKVRFIDTGRVVRPQKLVSGLVVVNLTYDGRSEKYSVAQLVANAFIKDGTGRVCHIDGDLSNNNVENLYYEQNGKESEYRVESWRDIIIDGENTKYRVSNKGNFKKPNGALIIQNAVEGTTGERRIRLQMATRTKQMYASKLVATAFLENPNNYHFVKHLDGDVLNNKAENLKWVYSRFKD